MSSSQPDAPRRTLARDSAHLVDSGASNTTRRAATFTSARTGDRRGRAIPVRVAEGFRLEAAMANAGLTWTKERIERLTKLWTRGPERQPDRGRAGRRREPQCRARQSPSPWSGSERAQRRRARRGHASQPARRTPPLLSLLPGRNPTRARIRPSRAANSTGCPKPDRRPRSRGGPTRSEGVTIMELREAMCRWPLGDPTTPEFRFCGAHADERLPYCAHHAQIAYQPAAERKRLRA